MNRPEFAIHWSRELGAAPESLVQLRGGINNQVFRCGHDGSYLVIKGYQANQSDPHDRMEAEVDFLSYAKLVSPNRVPELFAIDRERRCVVMEHIYGNAYPEGVALNPEDAVTALTFFNELNNDIEIARLLIKRDASEGFLYLTQHMDNVWTRISSMETDHLPLEYKAMASAKLDELRQRASRVEARLAMQIALAEVEDAWDPALRCVSPSDFGFHNAIKTSQGVKFIDFEFAGWDDPAKTAADFLLQPRVPVSSKQMLDFTGWLQEQADVINLRLNALKPVLRLKWACIILAILKPERLDSILRVNQGINVEDLIVKRLASSNPYLAEC